MKINKKELKATRLKLRLSQKEVAEKLGMMQTAYSRIENTGIAGLRNIKKIEKLFKITL